MAEQTTAQRIAEDMGVPLGAAQNIAAEIDGLRAEVERLKPAAEAWDVLQAAYQGHGSSLEYAYSKACVERAEIIRAAKERR